MSDWRARPDISGSLERYFIGVLAQLSVTKMADMGFLDFRGEWQLCTPSDIRPGCSGGNMP